MNVKVRDAGEVSIVDVQGHLTIGGPELALRDAVKGLIRRDRNRILINLRKVDLIDSAGIGEVMACRWRVEKAEGLIHLVRPEKDIPYKTLFLVAMARVVGISDDEKAALEAFRARPAAP